MSKQGIAVVAGPAFGELRTISAQLEQHQCQAMTTLQGANGGRSIPNDTRCQLVATVHDPRGPRFCWVHAAALNNPNRARKLHLHKSVTE